MKPYFLLMVTFQSGYDCKNRPRVSKVIGMNTFNIAKSLQWHKKALITAIAAAGLVWPSLAISPAAVANDTFFAGIFSTADADPKVKMTKEEKAARAAELAPAMTTLLTDPGFPATAADLRVDLEIVIYMGGFHLSTLGVTTAFSGDNYEIKSNVQTEGIVDWVVKTDAVIGARGQFIDSRARPSLYNSDITDKNQRQLVSISWSGQDGIHRPTQILSFPEYNLEKYPVSDLERQHSADPMSAIMQIILAASRSDTSPGSNPCGGTIPVYDGRRRFDLIMEPRGIEEVSTGKGAAFEGEALKCWIGFKRVAGYKPRKKKRTDRMDGLSEWPDIYMWLAPVKGRDTIVHMPVRFYADTRLGSVVARATKLISEYEQPPTDLESAGAQPSGQTPPNPDS